MRTKSLHSRIKTSKMRNDRHWRVKGLVDKLDAGNSGLVQMIPWPRNVFAASKPLGDRRIIGIIVSIQRTVQNPLFRTIPLSSAYDPDDWGDDEEWED